MYLIISPYNKAVQAPPTPRTNQFTFETALRCNHNMLLMKILADLMLPMRDNMTQVGCFTLIQLIIMDTKLIRFLLIDFHYV